MSAVKTRAKHQAGSRRLRAKAKATKRVVQPALVYVDPEPSAPVRHERVSPALLQYLDGLTEPLSLRCGCSGTYIPAASILAGPYPTIAVRIAEPCADGHPDHVAPGVICRFRPANVEGS